MAGKSVKAPSKEQPGSRDEAGQLSDPLRENRLVRTLLHAAMHGHL